MRLGPGLSFSTLSTDLLRPGSPRQMTASDQRTHVLRLIYDNARLWELCWPYTDAYGEPGFVPAQGYDWSGFRDSSDEAIAQMAHVVAAEDQA